MTKNRWISTALALALGVGVLLGLAAAEDEPPTPERKAGEHAAPGMPAWMRTTKEHERLAPGTGTFDRTGSTATARTSSSPGARRRTAPSTTRAARRSR